jgi:hypothetical protein
MEFLKATCMLINQGDFLTSIDLADAFLYALVGQSSRRYHQFARDGQLFQFRFLSFVLSLSPLVFTKVLRPLLRWARRKGIRISAYLDDLLIVAKGYRTSLNQKRLVVRKLSELGFLVKIAKSSLEPSQNILYLGFLTNTKKLRTVGTYIQNQSPPPRGLTSDTFSPMQFPPPIVLHRKSPSFDDGSISSQTENWSSTIGQE